MTPYKFQEANIVFGPPEGLAESQVMSIPAYSGKTYGGSCDGVSIVVVAWMPDEKEKQDIANGMPIYLSCLGGLPPHFLTTSFFAAISPA